MMLTRVGCTPAMGPAVFSPAEQDTEALIEEGRCKSPTASEEQGWSKAGHSALGAVILSCSIRLFEKHEGLTWRFAWSPEKQLLAAVPILTHDNGREVVNIHLGFWLK